MSLPSSARPPIDAWGDNTRPGTPPRGDRDNEPTSRDYGDSSPPKEADSVAVRVAVRVRPLLAAEQMGRETSCVNVHEHVKQVVVGNKRGFTYDYTFAPSVTQDDVFDTSVRPLVESFVEGFNATILAYGQTGAGKTYSMGMANPSDATTREGITQRVIEYIFDHIERHKDRSDFLLRVSFVEVYNEDIRDLLQPDTDPKSIRVREDAKGGTVTVGVSEIAVTDPPAMYHALERGALNRITGSTNMNDNSSRSHCIYTIVLEQRAVPEGIASRPPTALSASLSARASTLTPPTLKKAEYITSKFHLVDLAGSERAKRTGNTGVRFQESKAINGGLLALGNVVCTQTHLTYI